MRPGSNIFKFRREEDRHLLKVAEAMAVSLSSSAGFDTGRIDITALREMWKVPFWDQHANDFPGRTGTDLVVRFCELYLSGEPELLEPGAEHPNAYVLYAKKLQTLPKDVFDMIVAYTKAPVYQRELEQMHRMDDRRKELRHIFPQIFFTTTRTRMEMETRDALFRDSFATEEQLWATFYAFMFESTAYKRVLIANTVFIASMPSRVFEQNPAKGAVVADVLVKNLFHFGYLSRQDLRNLIQVPFFQRAAFKNRHLVHARCPKLLNHPMVIEHVAQWLSDPRDVSALYATCRECWVTLRHRRQMKVTALCEGLGSVMTVHASLDADCQEFLLQMHHALLQELRLDEWTACTPHTFLQTVKVCQDNQPLELASILFSGEHPFVTVTNVDCVLSCESQARDDDDFGSGSRRGRSTDTPLSRDEWESLLSAAGVDNLDSEVVMFLCELSLEDVARGCSHLDCLSEDQREAIVSRAREIQNGGPWPHARLPRPRLEDVVSQRP